MAKLRPRIYVTRSSPRTKGEQPMYFVSYHLRQDSDIAENIGGVEEIMRKYALSHPILFHEKPFVFGLPPMEMRRVHKLRELIYEELEQSALAFVERNEPGEAS